VAMLKLRKSTYVDLVSGAFSDLLSIFISSDLLKIVIRNTMWVTSR